MPVRAAFFEVPAELPPIAEPRAAGARRQPGRAADQPGDAGGRGAADRAPARRCASSTRPARATWTRRGAAYEAAGMREPHVEVVPFLDDVAGAMAASHLLVSRAGAITLAEICAAGRPSRAAAAVDRPGAPGGQRPPARRRRRRRDADAGEVTDQRALAGAGLLPGPAGGPARPAGGDGPRGALAGPAARRGRDRRPARDPGRERADVQPVRRPARASTSSASAAPA